MKSILLGREWEVKSGSRKARQLWEGLGVPFDGAAYLDAQGIQTPMDLKRHLESTLSQMADPMAMKDMDAAVERISRAILGKEIIGIYGDYDADGVTSTSLLATFFRAIGHPHYTYIPHREQDGYGLGLAGLRALKARGATLVLTVDCGITNHEEVALANELGMDVVVTDHHEPGETIPQCSAVINPKRQDCPYPFKALAGVGVAFNLVVALRARLREEGFFRKRPEPNLKALLDYVAIGTIGDIVPLVGENRIYVRNGLDVLRASNRPGIRALLSECSIGGPIGVMDVAFRVVPRINAAGRMDHARLALRLLLSDDVVEAQALASALSRFNHERQKVGEVIFQEAMELAQDQGDVPVMVLAKSGWKKGVVGIVASRLVEALNRPVVLLSDGDADMLEGSGRSVEGVDMVALLRSCSHLLEAYGGHKAAAGLSIKKDKFQAFKEAICEKASVAMASRDAYERLIIHMDLLPSHVADPRTHELVSKFEPYGHGCLAPVMRIRDFRVIEQRIVGKNHLKLTIAPREGTGEVVEVLGWGMEAHRGISWEGLELACTPFFNHWNGRTALQLELKDARPDANGGERA